MTQPSSSIGGNSRSWFSFTPIPEPSVQATDEGSFSPSVFSEEDPGSPRPLNERFVIRIDEEEVRSPRSFLEDPVRSTVDSSPVPSDWESDKEECADGATSPTSTPRTVIFHSSSPTPSEFDSEIENSADKADPSPALAASSEPPKIMTKIRIIDISSGKSKWLDVPVREAKMSRPLSSSEQLVLMKKDHREKPTAYGRFANFFAKGAAALFIPKSGASAYLGNRKLLISAALVTGKVFGYFLGTICVVPAVLGAKEILDRRDQYRELERKFGRR